MRQKITLKALEMTYSVFVRMKEWIRRSILLSFWCPCVKPTEWAIVMKYPSCRLSKNIRDATTGVSSSPYCFATKLNVNIRQESQTVDIVCESHFAVFWVVRPGYLHHITTSCHNPQKTKIWTWFRLFLLHDFLFCFTLFSFLPVFPYVERMTETLILKKVQASASTRKVGVAK
jgi:hypothetical protein